MAPTGKVSGRGAYLCPREQCWELSLRKSRLDHVLRSPLVERDREALRVYYQEQLKSTDIGDVQ